MRKLLTLLIIVISIKGISQAKIASDGSLEPTGNFPALKEQHLKGGMRVILDTNARNTIPSSFRTNGMLVQTLNPYQLWQLDSSSSPIWKSFSSGTNITSLPWDSIFNKPTTFPSTWATVSGKPENYTTTYALSNDLKDSLNDRYTKSQSDERYLQSFTETDPTVGSHIKSITPTNISNWDAAFGWGNHAGLYRPISWEPTFPVTSVFGRTGAVVPQANDYSVAQIEGLNDALNTKFPVTGGILSGTVTAPLFNYTTNQSSSYTHRSVTDKRYVDSIAGLLLRIADTASMLESYAKASQLLNYLPLTGGTLSGITTFLDSIVGVNQRLTGNIRAASFIRSGGTNTQALLADGSILSNPINGGVAITFLPVATGTRTLASSIIRQFDGTRLGISLAGDNGVDLVQVGGSGLFMNYINIMGNLGSGSSLRLQPSTTNSSARTWALASSISQFGDFAIRQSNAKDGDPITAGTTFLYFDPLGAATFNNSVISTSQGNIINATVDSLITGTSYTLVLTDAGRVKRCTNASGVTVQVPNNTSVAFPLGTLIVLRQRGGTITLIPDSGVTLLSAGNVLTSSGANTHISIMNVGTNIWDVYY